jgi:aminopeptidase N
VPDIKYKSIYLKDYTPPPFLINNVYLVFKLSPTKTRVITKIEFRPNETSSDKTFFLFGLNLKLITATINKQKIHLTLTKDGLTCKVPNEPFIWESEIEICPKNNTTLDGLYMSNGMYSTQCEPEGFRKITYYPDRPDIMAIFHVRIESDKPVLLSNGNLVRSGNGFVEWYDPWPKPAYLFALVAGNLLRYSDQYITRSNTNVELNIWVRPGDEDKCKFAMESLKKAMRWDEEKYGREYDLNLFNIVAVDDFNMGAMENKGLNIFNSAAVLATPETSTDLNFERIETIVAHEYFHNWTGNRVTCRDWFQLCLKEGLTVFRDQQFSADMRSESVKRVSDVLMLRSLQFREDDGPLAHPVRPDSFIEINNFYTATVYEKGAELIRMLKLIVGDQSYYDSVNLYFLKHDGNACTVEDWLSCFEEITGRNLTQFKLWYTVAGTPQVKVSESYSNGSYTLAFTQSLSGTPSSHLKPMLIPIALGLFNKSGEEILPTKILELNQPYQEFNFNKLDGRPIPSLLRNFSAPIKLEHIRSDSDCAFLIDKDTDPFNKWDASMEIRRNTLIEMVTKNKKPNPTYLIAIAQILCDETIDQAFKALIVAEPSQEELAKELFDIGQVPDPTLIYNVIRDLECELARTLEPLLLKIYKDNAVNMPQALDSLSTGKRSLQAVALRLINYLDGGELASRQFATANSMQQQFTALGYLLGAGEGKSESIRFYNQWKDNRLVMDKWFSTNIRNSIPTMAHKKVQDLTKHPLFEMQNPNRFKSVFGSFAANTSAFHEKSGGGYKLMVDWIIKLDKKNPQTAAKMTTVFDTWKRYDINRQKFILQQLDRMSKIASLSQDTSDILQRIRSI